MSNVAEAPDGADQDGMYVEDENGINKINLGPEAEEKGRDARCHMCCLRLEHSVHEAGDDYTEWQVSGIGIWD